MSNVPAYPKDLTKAAWKKQKSLFASGKEIEKKLDACETNCNDLLATLGKCEDELNSRNKGNIDIRRIRESILGPFQKFTGEIKEVGKFMEMIATNAAKKEKGKTSTDKSVVKFNASFQLAAKGYISDMERYRDELIDKLKDAEKGFIQALNDFDGLVKRYRDSEKRFDAIIVKGKKALQEVQTASKDAAMRIRLKYEQDFINLAHAHFNTSESQFETFMEKHAAWKTHYELKKKIVECTTLRAKQQGVIKVIQNIIKTLGNLAKKAN
ncbi:hypothetical protein [Ereboglobus luteus]|uniref:BAR domain-containing protein n=1 Tax=Ereboglobus luteus TaxID=1796921 RepID=A0A2U8E556_9BACT|nr:hypothetical protein [Ereboglobus luteus]AWI10069.1 hypothetical protein CKA38_13100 [Ereboglobus luteus]